MKKIVEQERPNHILHAGDVVRDTYELLREFPDIPLENVCGNCDYTDEAPSQLIVDAEGKRIMLCHGHLYHVKMGIGAAVEAARKAKVDVLVFGHTHEMLCTQCHGLWILNPGSIRGGWRPSYGVIEIKNGDLTCHTTEFKQEG